MSLDPEAPNAIHAANVVLAAIPSPGPGPGGGYPSSQTRSRCCSRD